MKLMNLLLLSFTSLALFFTTKMNSMENTKANDKPQVIARILQEKGNALFGSFQDNETIYSQKIENVEIRIDAVSLRSNPFIRLLNFGERFEVTLSINNEKLGVAHFFTSQKNGYLTCLHINSEKRAHGYGALLFACTIKKMIDIGCTRVSGIAVPIDLKITQSREQMLPLLINFYKQLGAQTKDIELKQAANMESANLQKALEGIYKILEHWEQKSSAQSNNTRAMQRAAAIVNHIAPK